MNELSATGTVIFELEFRSITARNSSFHILMNAKQKMAAIPGRVIGSTTFVIDWKTTDKLLKTVGPQTAAYELLARDFDKRKSMLTRAALQLKPNGQFVFERFTDIRDYAIFEHLLIVNQWIHNK